MKATINLLAGKLNPAIIEHIPTPSHQSPLIDARDCHSYNTISLMQENIAISSRTLMKWKQSLFNIKTLHLRKMRSYFLACDLQVQGDTVLLF